MWCIKLDPVWVEFFGARSIGLSKSIPFVDAVPVTLWVHGQTTTDQDFNADIGLASSAGNKTADLHVIGHVANLISVQIDHYQLLFLLRLSEQLTELSTFLQLDRTRILKAKDDSAAASMIVGCVIPQVEVTLVMPSPTPGKETREGGGNGGCGGDGESVVPDTASLADDLQYNTSSQLLRNNTNPYSMSIDSPTSMPVDPLPFEMNVNNRSESQQATTAMSSVTSSQVTATNVNAMTMTTSTAAAIGSDGGGVIKLDPLGVGMATSMTGSLITGQRDMGSNANASTSSSSATTTSRRTNRNSVSDATNFPKDINTGFMSMKKGFSSLMTSIDTAFKAGGAVVSGGSSILGDDMSDTISIRSDASSDSENFAVLTMTDSDKAADCMDVMFK